MTNPPTPSFDPGSAGPAKGEPASGALTGKLLIAMPGMPDPRFAHSVVLVCAHGPEGAIGLVVNRPLDEVNFGQLLEQLGIETTGARRDIAVRLGGPVETECGFVLHRRDGEAEHPGQMAIGEHLAMTTTRNILEDLARGQGPSDAVLSLGYAGWGPGQLEGELLENGWLTAEADDAILFGRDDDGKWLAALRSLGIDPLKLSAAAGHA